ncbi:hypothetical protein TcCL_Unassigned03222 [Trypanosoma cruzi]|nr:hypothetical protein TcCL_Unassigned03222 [Trypanosoma cruzi]
MIHDAVRICHNLLRAAGRRTDKHARKNATTATETVVPEEGKVVRSNKATSTYGYVCGVALARAQADASTPYAPRGLRCPVALVNVDMPAHSWSVEASWRQSMLPHTKSYEWTTFAMVPPKDPVEPLIRLVTWQRGSYVTVAATTGNSPTAASISKKL